MKRIIIISAAILITVSAFSQSPEKMSYQAVVRDASNNLITDQQVGMQLSILQNSVDGNTVYVETQTPTTNGNGLITLKIGDGTVQSGDFTSIDWSAGPYFLKTETDPAGGANYTVTGTSQLLSVPYALHAKTAESVTGDIAITEEDPVFSSWDKSTGISITESQISDLQNYISAEVDPQFSGWDKTTGIVITESQISDLQTYLTSESDPAFTGWDKSTGISITESQINDLGTYIETETDPAIAANFDFTDAATGDLLQFNGEKWVKVTPDYISDYTVTETDVTAHEAALTVSESQINDLQSYLTSETDPSVTANFDFTDAATGDLLHFNGTKWVKVTPDYISDYTVTETDVTAHEAALSLTESQISDLGNYIESETDPSVPDGNTEGEMQYWNGTEWVTVASGNEGQILSFINNEPVWVTLAGAKTMVPTDVYNPTTGEVWMNRNLGASQVATSSTDENAYGDLYQWGRAADGHESRTSGTTSTLATSDTPGHGDFIINNSSPADSPIDWRDPQNDDLWQGVTGTNNPCPSGYRLPTEAEWEAERASWDSNNTAGAFTSHLKLTSAGIHSTNGGIYYDGTYGYYWSSTVDGTRSRYLGFTSSDASMLSYYRAGGYSVRCIKN